MVAVVLVAIFLWLLCVALSAAVENSSLDQSKRTVLNLAMALRDPDAWGGEDAMKFKIRPLSEYHAKARSFVMDVFRSSGS